MIYVEFFDRDPFANICSCLAAMPEKVIMLGSEKSKMKTQQDSFMKMLKDRGIETEFINYEAQKNNLQQQVELLESIVEAHDKCVFDLTGGDEISLVAAGIVFERYCGKDKIRMQRVNNVKNMVLDCDVDGVITQSPMPELSIEDNIKLYGGRIVYPSDGEANVTALWEESEEFFDDVDEIWEVSRKDPKAWAKHIGKMALAEKYKDVEVSDELTTVLYTVRHKGIDFRMDFDILNSLAKKGLIVYERRRGYFCIQYKNKQVKRCMSKEGMALEMKVYVTARRITEDGNPFYHDVLNGVVIDWNGVLKEEGNATNEVDVCLMRGSMPIFVSCKSGELSQDELFRLSAIGNRFGNRDAKKILIMNHLSEDCGFKQLIMHRANDLGIRVIYDAHTMNKEDFCDEIRSLCKNRKNEI